MTDAPSSSGPSGPPAGRVLAVLLAAGAGDRFHDEHGGHKLLAELRGRPLASYALTTVLASGFDVVVITGAEPAVGTLALDLAGPLGASGRIRVIHNPRWRDGQGSSVACAVHTAQSDGADALVIGLADQPFITPEAWRAVATSTSPIAVATYAADGGAAARGHPVRLAAPVWPLLATDGDSGARDLMRLRPDLVEEVPCQGSADDVDTLEDLQRWN